MKQTRGFTLIELAIVLVIVTILVGGLAMPLSAQIQARRVAETRKTLEEAREAIVGYAIAHRVMAQECLCAYSDVAPYNPAPATTCDASLCPAASPVTPLVLNARHFLPCPDLDRADPEPDVDNDGNGSLDDLNNGLEDRMDDGSCANPAGIFPWASLGTAMQDAWGNRLHYRVSAAHGSSMIGFSTSSAGDNQVCATAEAACNQGTLATNVPVVLASYGPNGWGARNINGSRQADPTSKDELENTNADRIFISRPPTGAADAGGEFDDLVVWVPDNLLSTRGCPNSECHPQLSPP